MVDYTIRMQLGGQYVPVTKCKGGCCGGGGGGDGDRGNDVAQKKEGKKCPGAKGARYPSSSDQEHNVVFGALRTDDK